MRIQWYGHSSFLLKADSGLRIFADPCDPETGYTLEGLTADAVTISHDHHDHNYLDAFANEPVVIREAGVHEVQGVRITGIKSFHDEARGAKRGENLIFVYELEGLRIAHLGDLGCIPGDDAFEQIGKLDVLLCPVGGTYTIGPREACEIANRTGTNVFIPMHYQTSALRLKVPLLGVAALLDVATNCHIHKLNQSEATITQGSLGEDRLLVLDYQR